MWPDGFPTNDYARQARRRARLSQRAFAKKVGVGVATISRIESGSSSPSVALLDRIMAEGGLMLIAVEARETEAGVEGVRFVPPLVELDDDCRDGAERRYPVHLDLVVDPFAHEWWGSVYGLARPPETFRRDPTLRRVRRSVSQEETRHKGPAPRWPAALLIAARKLSNGPAADRPVDPAF